MVLLVVCELVGTLKLHKLTCFIVSLVIVGLDINNWNVYIYLLAVWQKLILPDYSHNQIMERKLAFGKDYLSKSVDNLIGLYNPKKDWLWRLLKFEGEEIMRRLTLVLTETIFLGQKGLALFISFPAQPSCSTFSEANYRVEEASCPRRPTVRRC